MAILDLNRLGIGLMATVYHLVCGSLVALASSSAIVISYSHINEFQISVSTKSPFAARDYRNKIIIHRRQTCGIACKVDTEQPLEFLASFWDYG